MKNFRSVWIVRLLLIGSILLSAVGIAAAPAPAIEDLCRTGSYSGGVYLICVPPEWNDDLVVYAHGYVAPDNPVEIPMDQLVLEDGTSIPETVLGMGYAFATTSYKTNGLAIKEGVVDLVDLVGVFAVATDEPNNVYLVGASEGGLITALAVEQRSDVFDGGLATCGPVGDFQRQINYWGDVRVLFDYFFPGLLPKFKDNQDPLIPQNVIDKWYWCGDPERNLNYPCVENPQQSYQMRVQEALATNPEQTEQLLKVAKVPTHLSEPEANISALVQLLWYSVFATNDAADKLDGQPYDNERTWYWGSDNDRKLNRKVERFDADPATVAEIATYYQTSGNLDTPIVMLHTLQDPTVPYWHEPLYRWKVWQNEAQALHTNIPILRYGHCNFTADEVLFAFGLLISQVNGETP